MRSNSGCMRMKATLPLRRLALILAAVTAFLALSIPPVLVTLRVGALIGSLPRTPGECGSLSTLTTFMLPAFGPVVVPAGRLPEIVNSVSLLWLAGRRMDWRQAQAPGICAKLPCQVHVTGS
jgi:hypothetical protein